MSVQESIELGVGDRRLTVPAGWEPIEVRPDPDQPDADLAAGVVEASDTIRFAANVMLSPPVPVDVDAIELGVGQVVTDVRAEGPVRRAVVSVSDIDGWSIGQVHLFVSFDERELLLVATLPSDRFDATWPAAATVLSSLLTVSEAIDLDGVLW